MAGITIAKESLRQVEYAHKQGDKHHRLVRLSHELVNARHNPSRLILMGGDCSEKATGDSHHE